MARETAADRCQQLANVAVPAMIYPVFGISSEHSSHSHTEIEAATNGPEGNPNSILGGQFFGILEVNE